VETPGKTFPAVGDFLKRCYGKYNRISSGQ